MCLEDGDLFLQLHNVILGVRKVSFVLIEATSVFLRFSREAIVGFEKLFLETNNLVFLSEVFFKLIG